MIQRDPLYITDSILLIYSQTGSGRNESSTLLKIDAVKRVARAIIKKHYPHYRDPELRPKPAVVQELAPEIAKALWGNHEFRTDLDALRVGRSRAQNAKKGDKRISPNSYNTEKKILLWLQSSNWATAGTTHKTVLVQIYRGIRDVSVGMKKAMKNEREGRGGFRGLDPAYAAELKARIVASKKIG